MLNKILVLLLINSLTINAMENNNSVQGTMEDKKSVISSLIVKSFRNYPDPDNSYESFSEFIPERVGTGKTMSANPEFFIWLHDSTLTSEYIKTIMNKENCSSNEAEKQLKVFRNYFSTQKPIREINKN